MSGAKSAALRTLQTGYRIAHARGELRKAGARYLAREHYMRSTGGSGAMFVVLGPDERVAGAALVGATTSTNCDRSIAGVCLVGPAPSQDAERSVGQMGVTIRQIKRSHLLDDAPMYESQLIRHAMRAVCDELTRPVLFVSYADPAATDERTGLPLAGWCYLASGFFYIGETTSCRWCVVDHEGRARSTRQGKITLTRNTLPRAGEVFHGEAITADWRMVRLPPARIWVAVQTPSTYTRRQAKRAWRAAWAQLNPARRVAAKQWIDHVAWSRLQQQGREGLGEPRPDQVRDHDRMQPALWQGEELTRTAAPVWVPLTWQHRMLLAADVEGETVAGRSYAPLDLVVSMEE